MSFGVDVAGRPRLRALPRLLQRSASHYSSEMSDAEVEEAARAVPGWRGTVARSPVLAALAASGLGLLVMALGYFIGWHDGSGTVPLFYVGYVVLVVPFIVLLVAKRLTLRQRMWGCIAYGLMLYLSYVLASPLIATRFDETLHVTTLVDLLEHRTFFAPHSLLPVSPYYPGMELATAGLHWLTGLPLMACQVLVVMASRVLLVVMLFAVCSRVTRSPRAGSIAVLLYGTSEQFWFFNSQYAYQTVALGLAVATIYLLTVALDAEEGWPAVPLIGAGITMTSLMITHHVTSWVTLATLWGWGLMHWAGFERRRSRIVLGAAFVFTVAGVGWTLVVGKLVSTYLLPEFKDADAQLFQMIRGETTRSVTAAHVGGATPSWELATMFLAMLLWCVLMVPGGLEVLRGRLFTRRPSRWLVLVPAVIFGASFAARFAPTAAQIADRASTFLAFPAALLIAAWAVRRVDRWRRVIVIGVVTVMAVGGLILGSGADWERVTGPYLASAEQRSVDHESISVARWAQTYLPTGSRFAADVTLSRLIPDYAEVVPDTGIGGGHNVGPLFYDKTITSSDLDMIREDHIAFVFVDTRLAGHPAYSGANFESGDPDAPVTLTHEELDKFASQPGFVKILGGPIEVYDVRDLWLAPRVYEHHPSTLVPGSDNVVQMLLTAALLAGLGLLLLRRSRRGSWSITDLIGPGAVSLAVPLPALMVLGAFGVPGGFAPATGSMLLAVLCLAMLVLVRPQLADRPRRLRRDPGTPILGPTVLWVLALGLVGAAIAIAVVGEWQGLLAPVHQLPAPSWGNL